MTTTKERRAEILALQREGLDDVAIACRLLCDVRVVMRVIADAEVDGRLPTASKILAEDEAARPSPAGPDQVDRPQVVNWGRGRMIGATP